MKIFRTENIQLVKQSLDVYTKQHEAIAQNVAQSNDPNYKRMNTDFSDALKTSIERKLKTTEERHFGFSSPLEEDARREMIGANEKVDVSKEMGELADNQIRYDFASRALQRMYKGLSIAITGKNY